MLTVDCKAVLDWQIIKTEFEWDGSLCDIYILQTDMKTWQKLLDLLRASSYQLIYTVDAEACVMPTNVAAIFSKRSEASTLLNIQVQGIGINCHFFTDDQIEFDIDPREVNNDIQFGCLCGFIKHIGDGIGQSVILTPENSEKNVILRYSPTDDQFAYTPVA